MPDMTKLTLSRPATRASTNGAHKPQPAVGEMDRVDTPVRTRRRPIIIAAGVALMAVAVVGMVSVIGGLRDTQDVLVLAKDINQGQSIGSADLKTARINSDAGLHVVLAGDLTQVVGKTVTSNLQAGTVLNPSALTGAVIPPDGKSVVGITLTADKLPGIPLQIGDIVKIVDTPREQDNSPVTAPVTTNAQVVAIRPVEGAAGQITIDVLVPKDEGNWVAARAATHRVALTLETRER